MDKVVVITGAAGGIGRAAAARFAAEGARLLLVDVNAGGLAETLAAVERAGGQGLVVEADVTRIAEVQRYVAAAVERWGGIDGFFNNAGILGVVSPLVDYPGGDLRPGPRREREERVARAQGGRAGHDRPRRRRHRQYVLHRGAARARPTSSPTPRASTR